MTTTAGNGARERLANVEAERSLLAGMLLDRDAVNVAADSVQAADFHHPHHGPIFDAVVHAHSTPGQGHADYTSVVAELRRRGEWDRYGPALAEVQQAAPATRNAGRFAAEIRQWAWRRHLRAQLGAAVADVADNPDGPAAATERLRGVLDDVTARYTGNEHGPRGIRAFMDQDHEQQRVDVIPGVLRRQRTCVLTGSPGQGKSLLLLQTALALPCGINPFTLKACPPKRTLYVQLENEPDEEQDRIEGMLAGRNGEKLDESLIDVQVRTGGVDITEAAGRAWLRGLVRTWQPDLLAIGPYKNMHGDVAPAGASDRHAALARAVHKPLDDIRREFGCAVILEAHPTREAKPDSDDPQDFLPAGGHRMEAWTGLGLCLMATEKAGTFRLGAWREPRRHRTELPAGMIRYDKPGWVWGPNDPRYTAW